MLEQNETYPGNFHIIGHNLESNIFPATLSVKSENKIELRIESENLLIGGSVKLSNFLFHTFELYDIQGAVFVNSKSESISLLNCSLKTSTSYSSCDQKDELKNIQKEIAIIEPSAYIEDEYLTSSDTITNARFKFSALSNWGKSLKIQHKQEVTADTSKIWKTTSSQGDKLIIHNYWLSQSKYSLEQISDFQIEFKNSITFSDLLDYGRIYNDLFALLTENKSDIENFYAQFSSKNKEYEIIVDYESCNPENFEKTGISFEYFTQNIPCIKNWYETYKNCNLAFALYFDTCHFSEKYYSDTLLDSLIRAFEGMITKHLKKEGIFINGSKNKQINKQIKGKLETILESINIEKTKIDNYPELYKSTVLDSFSHANELSLRNRLSIFLDSKEKYFLDAYKDSPFVANPNDNSNKKYSPILKKLISFRNAYAHGDDSNLSYDNIHFLKQFTKKMILVYLFTDVLPIDIKINFKKL